MRGQIVSRLDFSRPEGRRLPSQEELTRLTEAILACRRRDSKGATPLRPHREAEEGGCGVVGFATNVPVRGRHIFEPSIQMHNRGNGKGGGIAAAGLNPAQVGVNEDTLREDYLLQIALLDANAEGEVESTSIAPYFEIDHKASVEPVCDYRDLDLDVRPPDVTRYLVRVKDQALEHFAAGKRPCGPALAGSRRRVRVPQQCPDQ